MTVKVYKEDRKGLKDYVDNITVYFPYPKRLQEREQGKGFYIAGGFTSDGHFNRMHSDTIPVGVLINGNNCYFGKRLRDEHIPTPALEEITELARVWNVAVTEDTTEAWDEWNKA